MKRTKPILFMIIALFAGFILRGCLVSSDDHHEEDAHSAETAPEIWTCSMHPQIQLPAFGKCPICFMDLIPLEADDDGGGEREISVSPYAAKLMELETAEVQRRFAEAEIRMVGKVDYDETRVSTISAWVAGRLDRLFVDYTGIPVKKGEHLAELYSPELLTAQEELIQALQTLEKLKNSRSSLLLETAEQTVVAAREKLRLWGFTSGQIAETEVRGTPSDHMTLYSPAAGIVIHKNATEGMYVKTGTPIYTIADLSRVWILLDAYESDLSGLRYGGSVEFTTEAYPGRAFKGTISFIDPIINAATRTAKVRVIVENADGTLKPGMFVRAVARPRVAQDGRIMNPGLAGKWISPMHPEVIKDEPGPCDVCGMPLVTAESLGYVSENESNAPLLIPVSAALKTGKRAVVYVEIPDQEKPTYEGRVVVLGGRFGDFYAIESGLDEGEHVVTRGAFKLDAELQIRAKPSMMSSESEESETESGTLKPQTRCPVMGGEINKDVYVDYNGMRIYFCCAGCDGEFKADPEKYIAKMRAEGIEPEKVPQPQTLCPVMGNPINKDVYIDHDGMRIYFCCPGCDSTFKENPDQYLKQMRAEGIEPEKAEHAHAH
ncbi:efflux RND transporter periplasmic adaptor subunit [Pontiella agarivorans]|uniref:Efflux RND transporter periplasmic adaptor subunit n=1 Tax=Pontiella agarivorans TaxID=3038953 RepID=A0ABU5MYG4_9BACT|nr:efflux RND transporter periplasmic adaptor subunit [Pontiella agarivorans]MDZ8119021.1 efflux RND transporter periplasmic adaptor subunit [Pontiella agarivorans]